MMAQHAGSLRDAHAHAHAHTYFHAHTYVVHTRAHARAQAQTSSGFAAKKTKPSMNCNYYKYTMLISFCEDATEKHVCSYVHNF